MLLNALLAIFGLVLIVIIKQLYKRRKAFVRTIDEIPGPPGHPIFGTMLNFLVPPEQIWSYLRQLSKEYYPIYRYWQIRTPVINLICPEDIEVVLSSSKYISKGYLYTFLHPWLGTGLLTSTGNKWQQRRKILTPSFHFNILQQFLTIFIEKSENLVRELEEECSKPYTDMAPFITDFTLSSICETAMGVRLDKKNEISRSYVDAIFKLAEILLRRLTHPRYNFNFTFWLSSKYKEQKNLLSILHGFSESVIKHRKSQFQQADLTTDEHGNFIKKKRLAMLDLLIAAKNNGELIDDEGIREEVDTFMFEGHDTTAACINFTLLMLAYHSEIQERVVEELKEVFGDTDHPPTYQDLQNLRYLEQVIKESLRMYPSVPFISRVAEEEILTYTGYKIPANTIIQIHIYDLHHNPEVYPEPEKFDPDRFSTENVSKRHPFAYLPFSAGPRNCIGQKFALLEIKTVVSAILRKFVLKPIDTPSDITMIVHLVLRTKSGIKLKFEKR